MLIYLSGTWPVGESQGSSGHIAMGSDLNGFAGTPAPRHNKDKPCGRSLDGSGEVIVKEKSVTYPFALPQELKLAATKGTNSLNRFDWPDEKTQWDYNQTGFAHIGLMPDFMENLRLLGLTLADLEAIYRSARGVVELWRNARSINVPRDRHSLRWAPQSPFDVLPFNYWDPTRSVEAKEGLPPICRFRVGHKLGFESDGSCQLVEMSYAASEAEPAPVSIAAYHAGRCLDIESASLDNGAQALQRRCDTAASQLWQVLAGLEQFGKIINTNSGKCLAISSARSSFGSIVQQTCENSNDYQDWRPTRIGNTFHLKAKTTAECLEVMNQSREDGARVQLAGCTGASNQLWSIDSLRANDYEKLFQADRNHYAWLDQSNDTFSDAVRVSDESGIICRSHDSKSWIGLVVGNQCVGQTYDRVPATTINFQQLYQAR